MVKTRDAFSQSTVNDLTYDMMLKTKKDGFSDVQIAENTQGTATENDVMNKRVSKGIDQLPNKLTLLQLNSQQRQIIYT